MVMSKQDPSVTIINLPYTDRRKRPWRKRTITWRDKTYKYENAEDRNPDILPHVYVLYVLEDSREDQWWILRRDGTLEDWDNAEMPKWNDPSIVAVFSVPEDEKLDALDAYRLANLLGLMP